jgi:hypothetical protein
MTRESGQSNGTSECAAPGRELIRDAILDADRQSTKERFAMKAPWNRSPERRRQGLWPSVVTFAFLLLIVVVLFEYTNIFNDWLAWVIVPAVLGLVAYDVWLRGWGSGRED